MKWNELLRKCALCALGALLLGSLAACSSYAGELEVSGEGDDTVNVSDSDTAEESFTVETGYIEPKTFADTSEN